MAHPGADDGEAIQGIAMLVLAKPVPGRFARRDRRRRARRGVTASRPR